MAITSRLAFICMNQIHNRQVKLTPYQSTLVAKMGKEQCSMSGSHDGTPPFFCLLPYQEWTAARVVIPLLSAAENSFRTMSFWACANISAGSVTECEATEPHRVWSHVASLFALSLWKAVCFFQMRSAAEGEPTVDLDGGQEPRYENGSWVLALLLGPLWSITLFVCY